MVSNYTSLAYQRAHIDPDEWIPEKGFRYNEDVMERLYHYYQQLYFQNPDHFLWAGLARMTGGQVLYGMRNIVRIAKDPCALTVQITAVARAIFEHMAWQHELYLHDKDLLLQTCAALDFPTEHPYGECWANIASGGAEASSEGNKKLLRNEQLNTIQPYYEAIRSDPYSARYFRFTRFVMRQIHPHHRRFIFSYPFGDVTRFADRWKWIEGDKGMWARWIGCGRSERDRLVGLSNNDIVAHRW